MHSLANRFPLGLAGPLTTPLTSPRGPGTNLRARPPRVFPHTYLSDTAKPFSPVTDGGTVFAIVRAVVTRGRRMAAS